MHHSHPSPHVGKVYVGDGERPVHVLLDRGQRQQQAAALFEGAGPDRLRPCIIDLSWRPAALMQR